MIADRKRRGISQLESCIGPFKVPSFSSLVVGEKWRLQNMMKFGLSLRAFQNIKRLGLSLRAFQNRR